MACFRKMQKNHQTKQWKPYQSILRPQCQIFIVGMVVNIPVGIVAEMRRVIFNGSEWSGAMTEYWLTLDHVNADFIKTQSHTARLFIAKYPQYREFFVIKRMKGEWWKQCIFVLSANKNAMWSMKMKA